MHALGSLDRPRNKASHVHLLATMTRDCIPVAKGSDEKAAKAVGTKQLRKIDAERRGVRDSDQDIAWTAGPEASIRHQIQQVPVSAESSEQGKAEVEVRLEAPHLAE